MMPRFISEWVLRRRIRLSEAARQARSIPWDGVQRIALVISGRENVSKHLVDSFVAETKKFVDVFYVEIHRANTSYSDWNCFDRSQRTLLRLPRKPLLADLSSRSYDVVINTASRTDLFARSLSGFLQAPLKCAASGFGEVDLVIERPDEFQLPRYLEEVVRYLKMIRV